uniref:Uncharacterized protein n=1 Tax=Rhizophora mucronata TaxID=61149 RepID=A0A2P2N1Q4_RHIMU
MSIYLPIVFIHCYNIDHDILKNEKKKNEHNVMIRL